MFCIPVTIVQTKINESINEYSKPKSWLAKDKQPEGATVSPWEDVLSLGCLKIKNCLAAECQKNCSVDKRAWGDTAGSL